MLLVFIDKRLGDNLLSSLLRVPLTILKFADFSQFSLTAATM